MSKNTNSNKQVYGAGISGQTNQGRTIILGQGNYNENIAGNYCEQKRDNNTVSNISQSHSGSGDNVARDKNTTNIYNSQDLAQAAADIQALLQQLEETYPTDSTANQMIIAAKAIEQIEGNLTLKQKAIDVVKAVGIAVFEKAINNPAGTYIAGAVKGWQEVK